jgi:hypothetical protein
MNLEDVLDYGYIVAADNEIDALITWNGSAIFNFWISTVDGYKNTDVRTVYDVTNVNVAEKIAKAWLENPNDDPACETCKSHYPEDELTDGNCQDCVGE